MTDCCLALTVGDPAGIGPEIVRAALARVDARDTARLLVLGPGALCPAELPRVEDARSFRASKGHAWCDPNPAASGEAWELGRPQAVCGRRALEALHLGAELALEGGVDALVTGPVCKEALHLAGERVEGQTELLARWSNTPRVEMLAVAEELRVLVLTRHLPLREALAAVTPDRVLDRLRLLDAGLRQLFHVSAPRIALAGLNPHAGEAGLLGSEELDLLAPALDAARREGLVVHGPVSPDSVFVQARAGAYDGVLALYHDQGFIPIKLVAPETATTVLLGLPYVRVSPAHGTAFDIAGKGVARATNLIAAIEAAARLAG